MRILVFDVPASSGGALSVLKEFFHYVENKGEDHEWTYLVSTSELQSNKEYITVIKQGWTKRSILHRVFWELFVAPKIVKKINPDVILTLQNTPALFTRVPQIAYIHQPTPFLTDKKFSFFTHEERSIAIYRLLFDKLIKATVHKAKKVIVQTHWMKDAILKRYNFSENRIAVISPSVKLPEEYISSLSQIDYNKFFYPCSAYVYKNIAIIIEAVRKIVESGLNPVVYLTISGDENAYAKRIKDISSGLQENIIFTGQLSREKVFDIYKSHILLFPSFLETFGLPLLEARLCKTPIIAADRPFSREILEDYSNVMFFDPFSEKDLEFRMIEIMQKKHIDKSDLQVNINDKSILKDYDINNWSKLTKLLEEIK